MADPEEPLDPNATDQLAAAMAQPQPADMGAGGDAPWSWIPPSWAGAPQPGAAPPLPDAASAPPPVDSSLAGAPPPDALGAPPPLPPPPAPGPSPGIAGMPDISISYEHPAAPPPPVDAVTGAGGTPADLAGPATLTPAQREAAIAQRFNEHPDQLLQQLVAGPVDADAQHYLDQLALRDPQGFAELNYRLADAKTKNLAAQQQAIANKDYETQQANLKMRNQAAADAQAKSAQLDAEATRLANTQIGPHLSMFQKVAGVIMGMVGGLYQGRVGGRNIGLDALNEVTIRDVENQRSQLANQRDLLGQRRNALGEQYARSGDLYQAAEELRLAALKHADSVLATQQQNFAPDGTRGMQIAQMRAGIASQQAQAVQTFQQKQFDNSIKVQGAAREQELANETLRHNRASEGVEYAKLDMERGKARADNTVLTPEQIRHDFPEYPVNAIPPGGATVAELTKRSELNNKTLEGTNKTTANAMQQAGTQVMGPDGKPLTQDGTQTGAPVVIASHEQAAKINEASAGAQDLLTSLGKVRRFLASDPSTIDRQAWAAAKTDLENAKFAYAALHGTKASSRELDAMGDLFGPNPDSYTSRVKDRGVLLAHIDALVDDAGTTIDNKLRREAKYTGPRVLVDTSKPPPTASTADDRGLAAVLAATSDRLHKNEQYVIPGTETYLGNDQRKILDGWYDSIRGPDPEARAQLTADLARPADDSLHQKAAVQLREAAAARARALESLTAAANRSNSYGVSLYARQLLVNSIAQSIDASPGEQ